MNVSSYEFRARAREALGGGIFAKNWLLALVVHLVYSVIYGAASSFITIVAVIINGALMVGLAGVFMTLIRTKEEIKFEQMFDGFKDFSGNLLLGLMQYLYIFLWTLLFIIPGIVKSYSYSMCFYIKNDHPEYSWRQCIDESRKLMNGNKWKLFCLDFSFIGWIIVGVLACGIGVLWVYPYQMAARAAFYNELVGYTAPVDEEVNADEASDAEQNA